VAEGGKLTFTDPDGYAAAFGDARVNLTITGAGDFDARLTWLPPGNFLGRVISMFPRGTRLSVNIRRAAGAENANVFDRCTRKPSLIPCFNAERT
jgi:hypothetical protein